MIWYSINTFSIILLCGAAAGLLFSIIASLNLIIKTTRPRFDFNRSYTPPISVFKPLKGLDESLEQNLETFFKQNYPKYELIFGVNDKADPAIGVVTKLKKMYPAVSTKLIVNTRRIGFNPKVNNLYNMAPFASHGLWMISDSNVRVDQNHLRNMVAYIQDHKVGLVTSLIRGVGSKRLGAKLENLHLNSFIVANSIAVSYLLNIPVTIGKSMLIRKETMFQIGGFESLANYLIEDGIIGKKIQELGYRTEINLNAIENVNNSWSLRDFLNRHSRWAVMRRHFNLMYFFAELLSNPALLALLALAVSPTLEKIASLIIVLALKTIVDWATIRAVGGAASMSSVLLLPFKDFLITGIWCRAFFTNIVTWRGQRFRIGAMTRINPVIPVSGSAGQRNIPLIGGFIQRLRYARQRLAT